MGNDLTPAGWVLAAASVRGRDHIRDDAPCQDSQGGKLWCGPNGEEILLAAVSDGAGSASHSDIGSRLTVDTFLQVCMRLLDDGRAPSSWTRSDAELVVAAIQERLDEEAETLGVARRDLAATLVGSVIGNNGAAFLQVGDGAMVTPSSEDGTWMWVHWPRQGEYANTTFFVTQDTEVQQMQFDTIGQRVESVALFSDGLQSLVLKYEDQSVHSAFFDQMIKPVQRSEQHGIDIELSGQLAAYLSSDTIGTRSGDDVTLLLATRRR